MIKAISWADVTVHQYQQVYQILISNPQDDIEAVQRIVQIMYGLTSDQADNLSIEEFNRLAKSVRFLFEQGIIPGQPKKVLRIGGNRYKVCYDLQKMRHRQYVEVVSWTQTEQDMILNMHRCMASIVDPINWYGRRRKNMADEHTRIADDMLNAPVLDIYHSCVFFCTQFRYLIDSIQPYLVEEMMSKGMSRTMAEAAVELSKGITDGLTLLRR